VYVFLNGLNLFLSHLNANVAVHTCTCVHVGMGMSVFVPKCLTFLPIASSINVSLQTFGLDYITQPLHSITASDYFPEFPTSLTSVTRLGEF
jgi:hypothetical protein